MDGSQRGRVLIVEYCYQSKIDALPSLQIPSGRCEDFFGLGVAEQSTVFIADQFVPKRDGSATKTDFGCDVEPCQTLHTCPEQSKQSDSLGLVGAHVFYLRVRMVAAVNGSLRLPNASLFVHVSIVAVDSDRGRQAAYLSQRAGSAGVGVVAGH